MEFQPDITAYREALAAINAEKQRQAILGGLDPALLRDAVRAVEHDKQLQRSLIGQQDRDLVAAAFAQKDIEYLRSLMPVPPPYVDHSFFHEHQDRALEAKVKAEVARQLQEREDDLGRTDD
jgi:hypothetical protein